MSKLPTFLAGVVVGIALAGAAAYASTLKVWTNGSITAANEIVGERSGMTFSQIFPPDPCFTATVEPPPDPDTPATVILQVQHPEQVLLLDADGTPQNLCPAIIRPPG